MEKKSGDSERPVSQTHGTSESLPVPVTSQASERLSQSRFLRARVTPPCGDCKRSIDSILREADVVCCKGTLLVMRERLDRLPDRAYNPARERAMSELDLLKEKIALLKLWLLVD